MHGRVQSVAIRLASGGPSALPLPVGPGRMHLQLQATRSMRQRAWVRFIFARVSNFLPFYSVEAKRVAVGR